MRNLAIHHSRWCSAMSAALVLTLAPVAARADAPGPDAVQPAPDPAAPPAEAPATTEAPPVEPAAAEPPATVEPATAAPSSDPIFAPVDIPAPPPLPKPEPPPEPEPEPIVAPVEGPPEPEGPSPEQREKIQTQRRAGIGVMSTGAMLAGAGLGMTIAMTIVGDAAQNVEDPVTGDIERSDSVAQVGGMVIVSGVALAAIGGIIFANAARKAKENSAVANVRVAPALGGLVLSGRF
jgi:outer membrane biosynthesis protein TonB